ncbi:MAG: DUF2975 domain-containing protein [Chloroflexi bacterium]|nr:MAG: DUF2975 domain-containing protein [Chloroflexota bacterium]
MKKSSTIFLRFTVVLIGALVLFLCAYAIPRVVGAVDLGGYDPILLSLYIPAIPFFFALYQAIRLLGYIDKNDTLSLASVDSFRSIKYCALTISGLFVLGMPYVFYIANKDDAPGVVAIGCIIIFASFVIATFSGVLQKIIQNAVDIKSENDLTV